MENNDTNHTEEQKQNDKQQGNHPSETDVSKLKSDPMDYVVDYD